MVLPTFCEMDPRPYPLSTGRALDDGALCNHIQRGRAFSCKPQHVNIILVEFQLTHGYEANGSSDSSRND